MLTRRVGLKLARRLLPILRAHVTMPARRGLVDLPGFPAEGTAQLKLLARLAELIHGLRRFRRPSSDHVLQRDYRINHLTSRGLHRRVFK